MGLFKSYSFRSKSKNKFLEARKKWADDVEEMKNRINALTGDLYEVLPEDGNCDALVSAAVCTKSHEAIETIFTKGILAAFEEVVDESSFATKKTALSSALTKAKKAFASSTLLQNLDANPIYKGKITDLGSKMLKDIESTLN